MPLTKDQDEAVNAFLSFLMDPNESEMVLEGYPGCGKSFVTKHMVDAMKRNNKMLTLLKGRGAEITCFFTATTNKAAGILKAFIREDTSTIHSLLGLKVENDHKTGEVKLRQYNVKEKLEKCKNALIVIDEASYIDEQLLKIIRDKTDNCKILYIGDRYQLANIKSTRPPVFYSINNKAVLTTSKRFKENGAIAKLGQQFRDTIDTGVWKPIIPNGLDIINVSDQQYKQMIDSEFDALEHREAEAKILAWTNEKVTQYNNYIRSKFTSAKYFQRDEQIILGNSFTYKTFTSRGKPEEVVMPSESPLVVQSRAVDTKARYKDPSTNLDESIDCYRVTLEKVGNVMAPYSFADKKELLKKLAAHAKKTGYWGIYFKAKEELIDLRPTFACTVYKSQGSTYKKVFIDLEDIGKCHQPEQVARMLHVAVTRASEQVILRGKLPVKYGG